MKKITLIFTNLFAAIFFLQTIAFAQANPSTKWIRVQSENGEFSVEVPDDYGFIADNAGFSVHDRLNNFPLEEVRMFNSYRDKTLIAFETYKAGKKALDAIREGDKRNGKSSEIERGGIRFKQVLIKDDKFYAVRQYFNSKNYIYVLTAASRNGETAAMKRFFDSLIFKPDAAGGTAKIPDAVSLSALKTTEIEIDVKASPAADNPKLPPPDAGALLKDESYVPLQIISKPIPSYTNAARDTLEMGNVRLRIKFSGQGIVSGVGLLQTLGSGLTREAFFAALRIKFLPAEKDEKPVTVTKVVEYSFSIY